MKDRIGIRGKRSGRYTPFPKGLRFGSEREMSEEQRVELAKGGTQDLSGLDNTKYGRIFNIILIRIIRNTWSSQV